jgi:MFS family permease
LRRLTAYISALVALDLALWSAIVPLLPHLAHHLGLSKVESGLLLGGFSGAVLLAAVPVGHLADRIGMRTVTVAGSLLMAAATFLFAFAGGFPALFAARVAQGIASAVAWSAGLAWLAARAPEERRGSSIAIANASATGGMIAGPLLGGAVASAAGTRATFVAAACVSLALAGIGLTESDARAHEERESSFGPALRAAGSEPLIAVSLMLVLLVALVGGTLQVLMPLHLGSNGVSQSALGLLYSAGAVLGAVTIVATGRAGDRLGRLVVARVACPILGAAVAVLLLPLGTTGFAVMLVAITPAMSVLYGIGYPLGADGADSAGLGHGLVLGLVNVVWGLGAVVGPVAGAALAAQAGDRAAYATLVALCAGSAVLVGAVSRARPRRAPAGRTPRPARPSRR